MTRTKKVDSFGARLRTARKAKAWSRAELARRAAYLLRVGMEAANDEQTAVSQPRQAAP